MNDNFTQGKNRFTWDSIKKKRKVWLLVGIVIGFICPSVMGSTVIISGHWSRDADAGFVYPAEPTDDVNLSGQELIEADLNSYAGDNVSWDPVSMAFDVTGAGFGLWNDDGTTLFPRTSGRNMRINGTGRFVGLVTMDNDLNVVGDIVNTGDITSALGSIYAESDITAGDDVTATDDIYLGDKMYHIGDLDTYIVLNPDQIDFYAGGVTFMRSKEIAGQDVFEGNPYGEDVLDNSDIDFTWKQQGSGDDIFRIDALLGRVGIFNINPDQVLDVVGNTNITGDLNVTGDADIDGNTNIADSLYIEGNHSIVNGSVYIDEDRDGQQLTVVGDTNIASIVVRHLSGAFMEVGRCGTSGSSFCFDSSKLFNIGYSTAPGLDNLGTNMMAFRTTNRIGVLDSTPGVGVEFDVNGDIEADSYTDHSDERIKNVLSGLGRNKVLDFCRNMSIYLVEYHNFTTGNGSTEYDWINFTVDVDKKYGVAPLAQELYTRLVDMYGEDFAKSIVNVGDDHSLWGIRNSAVQYIFARGWQINDARLSNIENFLMGYGYDPDEDY